MSVANIETTDRANLSLPIYKSGAVRKSFEIVIIVFITFILCELSLRILTTKTGHVSYLLNKEWNYLVPLDVPQSFPSILPEKAAYRVYDPGLGWTLGKNGTDGDLYFSNADGYRCSKEEYLNSLHDVTRNSKSERYDVICIGDSFTHGDEVLYEQTWPYYLAKATGKKTLNLGVGGYGIDQAFLRYKYAHVTGQTIILGLISGDLERATTQIYNLTGGGLKTKPIFSFQNNEVSIFNSPSIYGESLESEFKKGVESEFFKREKNYYPAIVERDFWSSIYTVRIVRSFNLWRANRKPVYLTDDDRLRYCIDILKYADKTIKEDGGHLVVAILDNGNNFQDRKTRPDPWSLFRGYLEMNHLTYVDCTGPLYDLYKKDPKRVINQFGVHYTPEANLTVAQTLARSAAVNVQ